ncbi:MAG: tyrosine-type recombinase/integrase [Nocardioidaceae bacterium]
MNRPEFCRDSGHTRASKKPREIHIEKTRRLAHGFPQLRPLPATNPPRRQRNTPLPTGTDLCTTAKSLTPHNLRDTAASLAVRAGANVKVVQGMLGHASAAMTLDVPQRPVRRRPRRGCCSTERGCQASASCIGLVLAAEVLPISVGISEGRAQW